MSDLWYRSFFNQDYWKFHRFQVSAGQTAAEIAYLQDALAQYAPGRQVVDLGCGTGRHAMGLALAGYQMIGLDISEWAIAEAQQHSLQASLEVKWQVKDLLSRDIWPLPQVNAVISIDAFGWGSDADQLRLLRRIRQSLTPDGLLVLSPPYLPWIMRRFGSESRVKGEEKYKICCQYHPLSGRIQGSLFVSSPGSPVRNLPFDLRIYSTSELVSLMREAGFAIERLDADFTSGAMPGIDTRSIQVLARPLPALPVSLAVASWRTPAQDGLELRYAPDETPWLDLEPASIWESVVNAESRWGADAVGHYPVDDPYGAERAAPVVSEHFQYEIPHTQLTLGPGVTSLLHDLVGLADGGLVLSPHLVHPDLSAWALSRGIPVRLVQEPASLEQLIEEIKAERPSLVHLDRPNFAGGLVSTEDLYTLGLEADRVGAAVLVDESPATYLCPAGSAVPLIGQLDNLVVLRGLTKAYSWGGLRVGFAYASPGVSDRVRDLVAPLQVGELALRAALRLLSAGDIFSHLRTRIRTIKPIVADLLRSLGLEVIEGHPDLPWVVVPDPADSTSRLLEDLGIRGLRFVPPPVPGSPPPEFILLFCPLSDERMAMLRSCLGRAEPGR